jgi:hypothetical protein
MRASVAPEWVYRPDDWVGAVSSELIKPVLQLHCVDAPVAFSRQIPVNGIRKNAYLISNELKHGSWWPFR